MLNYSSYWKSRGATMPHAALPVCLCATTPFFAQCLEGPGTEVDILFRRIKDDPRHHSLVVVFEQLVECQAFSQWSMGYTGISGSESIGLSTAAWEHVEQHTESGSYSPGFILLQSLWDTHKNAF